MSNFFNINNGFFSFLSKLCDILFLSIIWLIVCIPIVTIGPANTALYYATVKVIRRERGYLMREFFKSFRLNFKNAAVVGVLLTVIFTILILDLKISGTTISSLKINSVLFGIYVAIIFFVLGISTYVFPVLSRFDLNIKQLIKTSALMSIRHLLFTILMILILLAGIVLVFTVPMLIVIIPATVTLLNSLIMERILKKYIPQAEQTQEDGGKDEWYLE